MSSNMKSAKSGKYSSHTVGIPLGRIKTYELSRGISIAYSAFYDGVGRSTVRQCSCDSGEHRDSVCWVQNVLNRVGGRVFKHLRKMRSSKSGRTGEHRTCVSVECRSAFRLTLDKTKRIDSGNMIRWTRCGLSVPGSAPVIHGRLWVGRVWERFHGSATVRQGLAWVA